MKVMLFAAGMGTRLKPLTDTMPKALVPVNGVPLLQHVIDRLCSFGADEVVVNVHHFSDQIIDYVATHKFGCNIKISDETDCLLDTGGGLKKASHFFVNKKQPVLIHNVDIFSNADLRSFYECNKNEQAALLVSQRPSSRNLLFDHENNLVGWMNVRTGEVRSPFENLNVDECQKYAFSGIHLFSPSLFSEMPSFPDKFSIIDFYLSICDRINIKGDVRANLQLLDVGKIDTLHYAENFIEGLKGVALV